MAISDNEKRGDPKCWVCGVVTKPTPFYGPLRCLDCWEKKKDGKEASD